MPKKFFGPTRQVNSIGLAAPINADFDAIGCDNLSWQVIWTNGSTPVGNIELYGSNDGVTFTQITLAGPPAISGASGNLLVSQVDWPYRIARLRWARSSGSCDLQIWTVGKSVAG